jgi:hypothetical protein
VGFPCFLLKTVDHWPAVPGNILIDSPATVSALHGCSGLFISMAMHSLASSTLALSGQPLLLLVGPRLLRTSLLSARSRNLVDIDLCACRTRTFLRCLVRVWYASQCTRSSTALATAAGEQGFVLIAICLLALFGLATC